MTDIHNEQHNLDQAQTPQENSIIIDKISVEKRNPFHSFLMKKMGVIAHDHDREGKWVQEYAKSVSNIIDNVNNVDNEEIRDLIDKGYVYHQEFLVAEKAKDKVAMEKAKEKRDEYYDEASKPVMKYMGVTEEIYH